MQRLQKPVSEALGVHLPGSAMPHKRWLQGTWELRVETKGELFTSERKRGERKESSVQRQANDAVLKGLRELVCCGVLEGPSQNSLRWRAMPIYAARLKTGGKLHTHIVPISRACNTDLVANQS